MDLTLRNVADGCALYGAAHGSLLHFLMVNVTGTPPGTLTALAAWSYPGSYVWAQAPLHLSAAQLAAQLGMSSALGSARAIAWLNEEAGSTPVLLPMLGVDASTGRTSLDTTLGFGNVGLQIPGQTNVLVSADQVSLQAQRAVLVRDTTGASGLGPDGNITMPLTGATAGVLCFTATWDSYDLFHLFDDNPFDTPNLARAGDLRYFQAAAGGLYNQYAYPTMPPVPKDGSEPTLSLDVELHPGAPFDGKRSRLRFTVGSDVSVLRSEYAATAAGAPVALVPQTTSEQGRAGFYFGLRAPVHPSEGTGPLVYLAPLGKFALELPVLAGGDGSAGSTGEVERVMCGLNSLEYFTAQTGDLLELVPSQPALTALPGSDGPLLTSAFTTSWVSLATGAGAYFAQPGASVNFDIGMVPTQPTGSMTLPGAVASRVGALSGAGSVPLVFYGGISNVTDAVATPAQLQSIENSALSPTRGTLLRASRTRVGLDREMAAAAATDPVFLDATGTPITGGRTSTPQGFVVALNDGKSGPAGTWNQLQLARSAGQYLAFDAADAAAPSDAAAGPPAGIVAPWLATTVLQDQLFLVLNDWQQFPMAQRLLAAAGFNFEVAPDTDAADRASTIMIFKFNTSRSLVDLIGSTGSWAHSDIFIGDPSAVAAAKAVLMHALAIAEAAKDKPDDPFVYFRDVVASKEKWTGLLSFNGPINGNGMPADLQMVFAGIDGQLRAHHFGVELNRISRSDADGPTIEESSLFGVIHYEQQAPAVDGDFGFAVEELNVAISNSTVTDFHAQVAVTINTLFGRAVSLIPPSVPSGPANTLRLTGRYQKHGDVGTLTFDQPEQAGFRFAVQPQTIRVLDQLQVSNATLAPVATAAPTTSTTISAIDGSDDPRSQIHARVSLGGSLSFSADPFPGVQGLDLFSYGKDGQGLGMSGIALDITCQLNADGKRAAPPVIVADLAATVLADNPGALRDGSLISLLPLTPDRFLQSPDGMPATTLGAVPLNVVELAPSSDPNQTRQQSRLTTAPHYALRLRLPLGSLGALADAHASLDAWLVLGWGPSSYTPDDDGAGVFVQLPALSAGALGFNLEGLLKTTFGDANLVRVTLANGPVYVVLFNNVALSLFGLKFPPRVLTDLILFAGREGAQSLGWSLAATELSESGADEDLPVFRELV